METNQEQQLSKSKQELLNIVKELIGLEADRSGNPWIKVSSLVALFSAQYQSSLEELLKVQGFSDNLRSFLQATNQFAIYGTPIHQEYYVANLQKVVPNFQDTSQPAVKKNPKIKTKFAPRPDRDIKTLDDLKIVLLEIIENLIGLNQNQPITIGMLSKQFLSNYKQPIRPVLKRICYTTSLIELLRAMPNLKIQKLENKWIIIRAQGENSHPTN